MELPYHTYTHAHIPNVRAWIQTLIYLFNITYMCIYICYSEYLQENNGLSLSLRIEKQQNYVEKCEKESRMRERQQCICKKDVYAFAPCVPRESKYLEKDLLSLPINAECIIHLSEFQSYLWRLPLKIFLIRNIVKILKTLVKRLLL